MGDTSKTGQYSASHVEAGFFAPDAYLWLIDNTYLPAIGTINDMAVSFPQNYRAVWPAVTELLDDMNTQSATARTNLIQARDTLARMKMVARDSRIPLSSLRFTADNLCSTLNAVISRANNGTLNEETLITLRTAVDRTTDLARRMNALPKPTFLHGLVAQTSNIGYRIYQTGILASQAVGNQIGALREAVTAIRGTPLERGPVMIGLAVTALLAGAAILIYTEIFASDEEEKDPKSNSSK